MKFPVVVPGEGPERCVGMVLGEAPGRSEVDQGRPFVGASGTLLNVALEYAGASRSEFFITNAFRGDVGWDNRNPTQGELADHMELLWNDIDTRGIRYVLSLGNVASNFLSGTESIRVTKDRGRWFKSWTPANFLVAYHPAYVKRRQGDSEQEFFMDVKTFVERCRAM